ncbi:sigma-54-dependent transcriptional regulator [Shewanella violacea]|uniref:Phosphoglycerate transport system transcriptional regulatory protein PgtA n=2 Tax=Shewanella violacea TaxID=60217 RepID=D4ZDY2_SHEVD|nr:sigma-54 dependent transcriptional regulator [Shewanella violacea]BAC79230.1 phosphoglycerate transport system transcription regulator [Shewanella violacea DSS12]BAJ04043.1 phosphoglycerate transport system transcriptional regulatory protein PgtA [Shewanella violacea DSS12]
MTTSNCLEILLVDDDQDVLDAYHHLFSLAGYRTRIFTNPLSALDFIPIDWPGIVVTDMYMPQLSGMELLTQLKERDPRLPVIMISGHGDIPMALKAVKHGACDFLEKPIKPAELLALITKQLNSRHQYLQQKSSLNKTLTRELIGKSAQVNNIRQVLSEMALLDSNVCIYGESGTGRHNVASLLHSLSARATLPLIQLNGNQIKTISDIENLFTQASQASIILSFPELLSHEIQHWLAEFLLNQERTQSKPIRLITIFSDSPEIYIGEQSLLPELYYIINQSNIELPPLRKRPDDIAQLFHYFLKRSCNKLAKPLPSVDKSYLSTLRKHSWDGNVRELRNVAELFAIGIVKLTGQNRTQSMDQTHSPLDNLVNDYEKQIIEDALYLFSGRVADAANYLQIPRKKLYLRLKKHGVDKKDYKTL